MAGFRKRSLPGSGSYYDLSVAVPLPGLQLGSSKWIDDFADLENELFVKIGFVVMIVFKLTEM